MGIPVPYTLMEGMEYYGVLNEDIRWVMYNPIQKPYNLNIIDTDARILLMAENRKNLAGSFILAVDATRSQRTGSGDPDSHLRGGHDSFPFPKRQGGFSKDQFIHFYKETIYEPNGMVQICDFITACVCLAACERDRSGRVEGICTLEGEDNHEGIQLIIPGTQFRAITDAEGKFFIQDIPGGEYTLVVESSGYESERIPFEIIARETVTLDSVTLAVVHNPAGTITGFVTLPEESIHDGITVHVVGTDKSVTTNTTGHYRLDDVAPGEYVLLAIKEGWRPQTREGVKVVDGQETTVPEFQLQSSNPESEEAGPQDTNLGDRVVRGVALLQGRADHSGIEVSLESMPEKSTITDATGNFTLSELGDGPYVLLFSHEGYQSETSG